MSQSTAKKMATNTLWNALENFSQMGIQMVCTFILARFLTPSDFGLLGMLLVFTSIAKTITDSGFGTALIRAKNVEDLDYSSVFYLNCLIGIILYFILYFSSGLIADFYHQPIFNDMCKVTFLVVPIFALQDVHRAIMIKNIQFKKQGLMSMAAALISSVVAIVLAYYWRNVWALVVQNLLMAFLTTLFYWLFSNWHPKIAFAWTSIQKYLNFSKNLLFTGLVGSFFNNLNALLIGRFYTSADLGFYNQANRINELASGQTTNIIKNVSFPILSQVNNNAGNLLEGYRKVIMVTVLFVGCVMAILMGVAQDIMQVLMGSEDWRIAGKYLFILGFAGMLRPLHVVNENILRVTGNSKDLLRLEIIRRCIMIVIIAITIQFDVYIYVCGLAIYSFLLLFLNLTVCGKPIGYSLRNQISDISPIVLRQLIVIILSVLINYVQRDNDIYVRLSITFVFSIFIMSLLFYKNNTFKIVVMLLICRKI